MTIWRVEEHPQFKKNLNKLDSKILRIFKNKYKKIKENPIRLKHLSGRGNFYREAITKNIRLIYEVEGNTIHLLTIGKHEEAYEEFEKRKS